MKLVWWSVAMSALIVTVGCSSSDSGGASTPPQCTADPWQCPAGQTCWADTQGLFKCMASGSAKEGEACKSQIGAAPCSDDLACLQLDYQHPGVCVSYCDGSHPCPEGSTCRLVAFQGTNATAQMCAPNSTGSGGGGGGGAAGTGGAGGAGGSGATGGAGGAGGAP
jgi:hypothetical protein